MKQHTVEKDWGREVWFHNSKLYCYKHLHVRAGEYCSLHYHEDKSETFVIIKGIVELRVGDQIWTLHPEDSVTIHPYERHQFRGVVDSIIAEASTHHKETDSIRVTREWECKTECIV